MASSESFEEILEKTEALRDDLQWNDNWTMTRSASRIDGELMVVQFRENECSNIRTTKARHFSKPLEGVNSSEMLSQACCVLGETDLMHQWLPMGLVECHEAIKDINQFSRYTRLRFNLPFPFGKREALLLVQIYDLSEKCEWIITMRSLESGRVENPSPDGYASDNLVDEFPEVAESKDYTRANIDIAYQVCLRIDGYMIFRQRSMIDLKLSYVPSFIVNYISERKIVQEMGKALTDRVNAFKGSDWEKRQFENQAQYNDIEKRSQDASMRFWSKSERCGRSIFPKTKAVDVESVEQK